MRNVSLIAIFLIACGVAFPQSNAPSSGTPSPSLPQDKHDGLTLSADAYSSAKRAKDKFPKTDPYPLGILPVEVFLRNDTDQPLQLDLSTIQLEVTLPNGQKQSLDWMTLADVADAVAHPKGPSAPKARRFPIGIPGPGKDGKVNRLVEDLRPFSLDAEIIPPRGAIHGFLFFDLSHEMSLAEKATLYVPNVTVVATKKVLIFFEVAVGHAPIS